MSHDGKVTRDTEPGTLVQQLGTTRKGILLCFDPLGLAMVWFCVGDTATPVRAVAVDQLVVPAPPGR